jgi:membrane protease YdiL (CAAX protease family)
VRQLERSRLIGWLALVAGLATLNYASRETSGKPPQDELYQWGTAVGGLFLFALILGLVLWIAHGRERQLLALRRPRSWPHALGLALLVLVGIAILSAALDPLLHPGQEQGLAPTHWIGSRAAAFVANFLVVAIVAPIVEELTFRGVGYSVLEPFGRWFAIVAVGVTFGLAHGLVEALPILVAFGAGLAWLRSDTGSVYPGILLHAAFNGASLILSVTT